MRIPVLLIAGLIAFGPAAHAAEATSDNAAVEAPPVTAPADAPVAAPDPAPPASPAEPPASAPSPPPAAAPAPARSAPPAAAPASPAQPPVYLSMDFTDVELPVLIKFISEQTRKNFIFDERVQGKITIISPRRITVDEAYNVFLSVLQVKGFATVEQGNT